MSKNRLNCPHVCTSRNQVRRKGMAQGMGRNLHLDTRLLHILLQKLPDLSSARIVHLPVPRLPELTLNGIYGELSMEKAEWKSFIKDRIKEILSCKPEAVFADNAMFSLYPIVHALRKKHIPVLTAVEKDGQKLLVRIPSGS